MTDQSGRYGAQGDQPWYPNQQDYTGSWQQQPVDPYNQQQAHQQQVQQQQQYGQQGYPQQADPFGGQQQAQYGQQGYPQQAYPQQGGYQQAQMQQQTGQQGQFQQQGMGQGPMNPQGMNPQGMGRQGMNPQGMGPQGMSPQAMGQQGMNPQGMNPQAMGRRAGQPGMVQQQGTGQQAGMGQQAGVPGAGRPQQVPPQTRAAAPVQPSGPGPDGIDWEAEAAALDNPTAAAEPEVEEWEEAAPEDEYQEDESGSFFGGEQDNSREAERKRKEKGKKAGRRNSGACLVVALVLLGGAAGAGWWGYGQYQTHFGPPPDYTGDGTGSVNITIKDGAGGGDMGLALKDADVVKSIKAFVAEFDKNPKARGIQPGVYTMRHQMSAQAALQELLDSNGGNVLVLSEGKRASDIYALIDKKLQLQPGATAAVAKDQVANLGLPAYANGNLEGFLYPTRYSITQGMKPEELLKQMVANATQHFADLKLDEGAQKIGLKSGYDVLVEASILQAEGNNDHDFGKIARVLYNRLNTNATQGRLQLDTTLQYKLGRTKFTVAEKEGDKSPYNTYVSKGLPPTPISNPGDAAIQAVLNPTPGDWVYFVAVSPTDTRFSVTFDAFKKDVKDYCTAHNWGFDEAAGMCKTQ